MASARTLIVVACAATILLEPAVDVRCHSGAATHAVQLSGDAALPTGGPADPCGSECVPDCYCCSTPLATFIAFDPPAAVLVMVSEALPRRPLDGVAVVPDLPPIA